MDYREGILIARGLSCKWCSSSNAMAEYDNAWKCFSCNKRVSKRTKTKSIQPRVTGGYVDQIYSELPDEARAFLYQYHFTEALIEKYRISFAYDFHVWSNRSQKYFNAGDRLILPHYEGDKFCFLEGRTLDKTNDLKYVTVGGKKQIFKTFSHTRPGVVVIVEDIASAIRVGEVCSCIALRGTSAKHSKLIDLVENSEHSFIVWLDGDKPGQDAARILIKHLHWFCDDVRVVVTPNDPKCYSDEEIKTFLMEALK